jgi:hypothetical protein
MREEFFGGIDILKLRDSFWGCLPAKNSRSKTRRSSSLHLKKEHDLRETFSDHQTVQPRIPGSFTLAEYRPSRIGPHFAILLPRQVTVSA